MFYRLCQFNTLVVNTPTGPTKPFKVGAIMPQGSSYAAICSSVNLDRALIKGFNSILGTLSSEQGIKLRPLSFQDDILKLSGNKSEAQISQETIYNTVSEKTLEFNLSKCSVIIHGSNLRTRMEREVYSDDSVITGPAVTPLVVKDKYLGDTLHEKSLNDCWKETVKSRAGKVRGAVAEVMAVVEDLKACNLHPVAVGLMLWNRVVLPSLLYNSNTWLQMKEKDVSYLETFQYDFLRRLLRAPRNTLRAGLLWECGQWPLRYLVMQNKIMLFRHLINLPASALARQVFEAESPTLEGLKFEVLHFCQMNRVPVPARGDEKEEYKKLLTKIMTSVVETELRAKITASSTMRELSSERFETKRYLLESTLGRARLIFSYRSGTTDRLVGNRYGTQISRFCLCGAGYETSAHVAECTLYRVCAVDLPDRVSNPYQITEFWRRVLELKARLTRLIPQLMPPSPVPSRTGSPASPGSSTGSPLPSPPGYASPPARSP